jgi:hypothetical protein
MTLSVVFLLCGFGVLLTALFYAGGIYESNRQG